MDYNWKNKYFDKYIAKSVEKELDLHLDMYKLYGFYKIITITFNTNESWDYFIKRKHFLRIIINDINRIRHGILEAFKDYHESISIHICFDANKFNKLIVQTYSLIALDINILNCINDKILEELTYIYDNILQSKIIENSFIECYQLRIGDIIGYYNLDKVEIDGGISTNDCTFKKVIKLRGKYRKIICDNIKYPLPTIETIKIDRRIIIDLVQMFLRCSIDDYISSGKHYPSNRKLDMYELDNKNCGRYVEIDRNKIFTGDINGIPKDTSELITRFYNLGDNKKNVFLMSCEAYIEANKSKKGKAIMFYTIALENIANFVFKTLKVSKKKKIYLLCKKIYGKEIISQEFIDYFYDIRCLYSHEGICNNGIKEEILGVEYADDNLCSKLEKITYSTLIKWLIKNSKGELYEQ